MCSVDDSQIFHIIYSYLYICQTLEQSVPTFNQCGWAVSCSQLIEPHLTSMWISFCSVIPLYQNLIFSHPVAVRAHFQPIEPTWVSGGLLQAHWTPPENRFSAIPSGQKDVTSSASPQLIQVLHS